MRRYLELARAEFRRYSTYRLAIAAGVFTNTVFGFIKVGVLFGAIRAAGGEINGYDNQQAATYVWLGQALLAPVALFAWSEVADRVRTGPTIGLDARCARIRVAERRPPGSWPR